MDIMTRDEMLDAITDLTANEAYFCLQALLVAGHVNSGIMQRSIDLAKSFRLDEKQ